MHGHRAFLNLGYETRDHWKVDYTLNWQGRKRIPSTASNPEPYRLADYSPDFFLMNAQISETWHERFELYVGMENLTNYMQDNPVLAGGQPFGPYFDSSLVWGPILGRVTYFGLRFKLEPVHRCRQSITKRPGCVAACDCVMKFRFIPAKAGNKGSFHLNQLFVLLTHLQNEANGVYFRTAF